MRSFVLLALGLLFVGCTQNELFKVEEIRPASHPTETSVQRWRVQINPEVLKPRKEVRLTFVPPKGATRAEKRKLTLKPIDEESLALDAKQHVWLAKMPKSGQEALFMTNEGRVEARIPMEGKVFRLHTIAQVADGTTLEGVLDAMEEEPSQGACGVVPELRTGRDEETDSEPSCETPAFEGSCSDPLGQIDLAILYSRKVACLSQYMHDVDSSESAGAEVEGAAGSNVADAEAHCANVDVDQLNLSPIEDEIHLAVAAMNVANSKSLVQHVYKVAYVGMWDSEDSDLESEKEGSILSAMRPAPEQEEPDSTNATGDAEAPEACYTDYGELGDEVFGVRAAARADLVTFVYHSEVAKCGIADGFRTFGDYPRSASFKAAVDWECLHDYILAHEIGHNLDAQHNRESGDASSNYDPDFNHGHIEPSFDDEDPENGWLTIMSYRKGSASCTENCGCPKCARAARYSNPEVKYPEGASDAVSTGSNQPKEWENNALVLNCNAPTVSRFRCVEPGGGANVWMKDFWADLGDEPQLEACEDQPVWRSPWIWVRNTQDKAITPDPAKTKVRAFEHEHVHQSPIEGQPNYVYVKIHNTGGASSQERKLELYYAPASTGLNDPNDWTEVADLPPTKIAAGATEVFEFVWDDENLPGGGDYALLARWNEGDTPFGELDLSSLSIAVRNDNDLIWRNLNIIELTEDTGSTTGDEAIFEFVVPPDAASPETYLLITVTPLDVPAAPATSWGDLANVSVQVPNDVRGDRFEAYRLQKSPAGFNVKLDGSAPVQLLGPIVPKDGSPQEVGSANTFRVRVRPGPALGSARKNLRRPLSLDVTVTQIRPLIVERLKHLDDPAAMFRRFRTQVVGGLSYTIRVPRP